MSNIIEQVLQTNMYIQPIHFTLAIITNILNIRVLCSRALRLSPCTYYFLGYAIFSIIYTCLLCPIQFLRAFYMNWVGGQWSCKLINYFLFVFPFQINLMLVFAVFDRYYSSSQLRQLHSKSTIQTARVAILLGTLSCIVYLAPVLFIFEWNNNTKTCLSISNLFASVYIFSQVILYDIVAPLLMIIFGLLTISNIREQSNRVIPFTSIIPRRRTEGNLARMLLLQVGVHLIIVLPYGVIYSMNSFVPSTQRSRIIAIRLAFVTWQQCDYFTSFFLYILSARIYRKQLIRIFKSMIHRNIPGHWFEQDQRRIANAHA